MRAGCVHSVQWFAQSIALEFHRSLTARTGSMADALAVAITKVAGSHGEQCDLAGGSPSATVAACHHDNDLVADFNGIFIHPVVYGWHGE